VASGPHPIQGIGRVQPSILKHVLDGYIQVSKEEYSLTRKDSAKEEGILVGISSGASISSGV
jgi:cysteine synthase A